MPKYDIEEIYKKAPTIKEFNYILHGAMQGFAREYSEENNTPLESVKTVINIKGSANSGLIHNIAFKQRTNDEVGIDNLLGMGESLIN